MPHACEMLSNLDILERAIATVTRIILNTRHHQAEADDYESQVLLDTDLAILSVSTLHL